MKDFSDISCCSDVTDAHISQALVPTEGDDAKRGSRSGVQALLAQMAHVATPGDEVGNVLILLARLSRLQGSPAEMRILLRKDGKSSTKLWVRAARGRFEVQMFAPLLFPVPMHEFARVLAFRPDSVAPLRSVSVRSSSEILLSSSPAAP